MTEAHLSADQRNVRNISWLGASRGLLSSLALRIGLTVAEWRKRINFRRELEKLSDHDLRDMGLFRSDVNIELRNPFWKKPNIRNCYDEVKRSEGQ